MPVPVETQHIQMLQVDSWCSVPFLQGFKDKQRHEKSSLDLRGVLVSVRPSPHEINHEKIKTPVSFMFTKLEKVCAADVGRTKEPGSDEECRCLGGLLPRLVWGHSLELIRPLMLSNLLSHVCLLKQNQPPEGHTGRSAGGPAGSRATC